MPEVSVNGKAKVYLQIITVLLVTMVGVMSYVFGSAVMRNDKDHTDIKAAMHESTCRLEAKIDALSVGFQTFQLYAPPNHKHLDDGSVAKIIQ